MKKDYINVERPSEIQITTPNCEVWIGTTPLVIDKMFGPTIFTNLRIRADLERCEWVIERQGWNDWEEWATIPAQLPEDFPCQECYERLQKDDTCINGCKQD